MVVVKIRNQQLEFESKAEAIQGITKLITENTGADRDTYSACLLRILMEEEV